MKRNRDYSAVGDENPLFTASAISSERVVIVGSNNAMLLEGTDSAYNVSATNLDREIVGTVHQPASTIKYEG